MQTTKFLFVISLMAALVAPTLTGVAQDTAEQIKVREALRKKMAELEGASAPTPAPVTTAPSPAPAPPVKPAKPAPPTAPPQTFAPVPPPSRGLPAAFASSSIFGPVPDAVEDANTSRLREALRQQIAILEFGPVPEATNVANASWLREVLRQEITLLDHSPLLPPSLVMQPPLSPLSGSQSARLAELLRRYNADEVTPKEYHTQRAAILAEP